MTKLNVLIAEPAGQRFDCHGCTNCCRELVVHLTPADRERIDSQNWRGRLQVEPYVVLRGQHVLNHVPQGGCVFLDSDGRCRIHAEHGPQAKPLACQLFPFSIEGQGDAHWAAVRFDCPSVARSVGQPVARHRAEVNRIATAIQETEPALMAGARDRLFLSQGRPASETEAAALVGALDGWLADRDVSLERRLAGMWRLVSMLREAKLNAVRDDRFVELIGLLRDGLLTSVTGDDPIECGPPTPRQTALFRQAIFAHCEHLDLAQARAGAISGLRFRMNQLGRARRFIRATAPCSEVLGGVVGVDRPVTHDQVARMEPADGDVAIACEELATRYVRQRILARAAFGNAFYGWSMLDGLASLMLSVAVAGWLGRYFAAAAGRVQCETDDFILAVGIVDRAGGRSPELGSRSASLRLTYLTRDDGLLSLLQAWPWVRMSE